jgi:hypothetical protein
MRSFSEDGYYIIYTWLFNGGEIANILPPTPEYKVITLEFEDVKAGVAALEKKRTMSMKMLI